MSFTLNTSAADKAGALAQFSTMIERAAADDDLPQEVIAAVEANAAALVGLLPDSDPRAVNISINAVSDSGAWVGFQVAVGLLDG